MSKHVTPRFDATSIEARRVADTADADPMHWKGQHLTVLREAWREGVESGGYKPFDSFLDDLGRHYASRLRTDA